MDELLEAVHEAVKEAPIRKIQLSHRLWCEVLVDRRSVQKCELREDGEFFEGFPVELVSAHGDEMAVITDASTVQFLTKDGFEPIREPSPSKGVD